MPKAALIDTLPGWGRSDDNCSDAARQQAQLQSKKEPPAWGSFFAFLPHCLASTVTWDCIATLADPSWRPTGTGPCAGLRAHGWEDSMMKNDLWLLIAALLCIAGSVAGSSGPSVAVGLCFLVIFLVRRRAPTNRPPGGGS